MSFLPVPLKPRNSDGILRVIIMGRISTVHQDVNSIVASQEYARDYLKSVYDGPMEVTCLGEQASGMLASRQSIETAEAMIATRSIDLVLAEDLGRIYRNPRYQYDFVQNAVDHRTRVICVADNLDTSSDNWETMLGVASLHHGATVPETRRRVRRTADHSFRQGGVVMKVIYGYRKLTKEEAASGQFGPPGLRLAKLPECTPVLDALAGRLLAGDSYREMSDWLVAEKLPTGHYVTSGKWSPKLVRDLLSNPLLGGVRTHRKTVHTLVYSTGKHQREKNENPDTEFFPALAHFNPEVASQVLAEVERRTDESPAQVVHRRTSRKNIPWKSSVFPGQSATCAICGGAMYLLGKYIKCGDARRCSTDPCWNHVQAPVALIRNRIVGSLVSYSSNHPEVRRALADASWRALQQASSKDDLMRVSLDKQLEILHSETSNLSRAIAKGGELQSLIATLQAAEEKMAVLQKQRDQLPPPPGEGIWSSAGDIEPDLESALNCLISSSFEFANVLRRLFPTFVVQPVQALDCPAVFARASILFRPSALVAPACDDRLDDVPLAFDLFEPAAHIRAIHRCLSAKAANSSATYRQIGEGLGLNYMTVKRALDYARMMETAGMRTPYRELTEPPANASRWKLRASS